MNQHQVKYTLARVDAVERRKIAAFEIACTVPAKTLPDDQIVALVKNGSVKIKKKVVRASSHLPLALADVFDLSAHVLHKHVTDDFVPGRDKIKAEASKVRDEIVLGDNTEALHLLRAFDN